LRYSYKFHAKTARCFSGAQSSNRAAKELNQGYVIETAPAKFLETAELGGEGRSF
jgi:hypothetical protein